MRSGFYPRFTARVFYFHKHPTMAQTVTSGPFTFMTKAQLDAIRVAFAAQAPEVDRGLAGSNIGGSSFTFSHSGVAYQREEFAALLQHAYWQLGETKYGCPPGNRTAARFGFPVGGFPGTNGIY